MSAYEDLTGPSHTNAKTEAKGPDKKPIWLKVEPLPGGRARVHAERGALDHTDQFNLKSERQRLRFAQACDAKDPGCLAEVLSRLEKEALLQSSKYNADHDDGCRFVFTSLNQIPDEPTDWLWQNYIPSGAVTLLDGDPGVGKTLLLCDLAARTSRGFLAPDRNPAFDEPGSGPDPCPELVWWFAGSDSVAQTLAPRLRAAGADPSLVRFIEATEDMKTNKCRSVSFPDDFASLWKSRAHAPRLVVVDPLAAFCGGAHNHQAAQKALAELARFASSTGAAVVVVRASSRTSGGPSPLAEARSALLLAQHPSDDDKQVLAVVKSNLCAKAPSLELQITDDAGAPRIAWFGRSPLLAHELVGPRPAPARSPFETKKVEEWLSEKLSSGPAPAQHIKDQAALDEIPPILLRRAQISLNVIPTGSNGSTTWRLSKAESPSPVAGEGLGVRALRSPSPLVGEGLGVRGADQPTAPVEIAPAPAPNQRPAASSNSTANPARPTTPAPPSRTSTAPARSSET